MKLISRQSAARLSWLCLLRHVSLLSGADVPPIHALQPGSFSFRQKRPQMTRMGRIFADLIRVAPLDPPDLRSIAQQIGKLNSPALQRVRLTAHVELLNSKVKARNGKADANGVVVWLEAPGLSARANRPRQKLNQRGKRFLPHVMVVEKGSEVDFPNSDLYFHNVFSLFNGKRFDLGLYASGESRPVLFNRVGVSYIFCNIHPLMSAIVIAVDTPYYAISDQNGNLTINDVPEGRYQLKVWHERSTPQELANITRTIQVSAAGTMDLGVLRINEAGFIPQPHPNKHGQAYDNERNKPAYKK